MYTVFVPCHRFYLLKRPSVIKSVLRVRDMGKGIPLAGRLWVEPVVVVVDTGVPPINEPVLDALPTEQGRLRLLELPVQGEHRTFDD
jgi:hypothetical protein